jgi:hypothetical protein
MSDWTCTQLCEFEYDTVLCADARVLMEQYFIDRLREAGYKDMRMKNNAICQDTTRRAQMGSFALLPEHRYSLQMASLAAHHHPVAHGHAAYHPALHAQHPALLHAAYGYHHNGPARVVGAHPHEGWRGAQHVMRRAAQLPQPHVGHGGPHALLNEISGQALHRYRAHHWVDKVDPSEIDARCAATLASAQRLATAVLALCESGGGNVAPVMADIAGSLALLQAQLPTDDTGGGELEAIAALRAQLDALEKQVADRQTESGEADTPDAAEP